MKKLLSAIALVAVVCSYSACASIKAEGKIVTETKKISNSADEISISDAIMLTLSDNIAPGEIAVTTHENIHKLIKITNNRGEIEIELTHSNINSPYIAIAASSRQFNSIEASDNSKVILEGESTFKNYSIELSGEASFSGEFESARTIEMALSGAATAKISGYTNECEAELSGESAIYGNSFTCRTLDAELSGESKITMKVTKKIEGELSGESSIKYEGTPRVSAKTSGSSSVKAI